MTSTTTTTSATATATTPAIGVPVALIGHRPPVHPLGGDGAARDARAHGPGYALPDLAHLHLFTEDGLPEVYELIAQEIDRYGTTWVHIDVPMRPNGVTGWVPEDDLTSYHVVRSLLLVNLTTKRLTLFNKGKVVFRAPVGVGKPSTPTPTGRFWVREKFPVKPPVPLYGPYAIGTSDYSTTETDWPGGGIIGIHGTDQPSLVPGDPSHGCVRLHNADITRLYPLVQIGTPIVII